MKPLPATVRPYRRTPLFTAETVPPALLADHCTKAGVWGVITVVSGRLEYRIAPTGETVILDSDRPGVVEPQVVHHVRPLGGVTFYVEFCR